MATKIPVEVKQIVCFIFVPDQNGAPVANGTGFFVGVNLPHDQSRAHVYLVTAKHVLQDKTGQFYKTVWVRLNKLEGDAELVRLDLVGPEKRIFTHPSDDTVDVAVIPALLNQKTYDFRWLPEQMFTTREQFNELKITEGSDVFFTGLFTAHIGERRNYPIVRFGRVAMVSDEKIPWRDDPNKEPVKLELYLIESQSFGGNSGSPVFFYLGADREPGSLILGPPVLKLAGVMKGSFDQGRPIAIVEAQETKETKEAKKIPATFENMGIAAVIPSYLLHETLFSDELQMLRANTK